MPVAQSIAIHVTHLGFLPEDSSKRAVITGLPVTTPIPFSIVDVGVKPYRTVFSGMTEYAKCDFGAAHTANFGKLRSPGLYQLIAGDAGPEDLMYLVEEPRDIQNPGPAYSVPFWIRDDLYEKPLRMAFNYYPSQRSGVAVPGYHAPSHLDDGILEGGKEWHDATGGWYDGGNSKKTTWITALSAYSLCRLQETISPDWPSAESKHGAILAELQFVFPFLLKMQDRKTGTVYRDVGGGEDLDSPFDRWTDNRKSRDDRVIHTEADPWAQGLFIAAMAAMARILPRKSDQKRALKAAKRCAAALPEAIEKEVISLAVTIIGLRELSRVDEETSGEYIDRMTGLGELLLELQETRDTGSVTGFFLSDERREDFHRHHALSGIHLVALSYLEQAFAGRSTPWRAALMRIIRKLLQPLTARNLYGIAPYGVYKGMPLGEHRRDLGAGLSYRYFMSPYRDLYRHRPLRKLRVEHGLNSHLMSTATGLAIAARVLGKSVASSCRKMAEDQVRWVFGFNPLDTCFMTGLGHNNPFPHSRFAGHIPGGIIHGAIGGPDDLPWTNHDGLMDWRTSEYGQMHAAWFLWLMAELEGDRLGPSGRESLKSVGSV